MLINLRNALMTGKRLPYDAEVEFLGMTGGQYINTGIVGSSATKVEISAYSTTNATTTMALFGARNASNGNRPSYSIWRRAVQAGGERMRFDYNSASADSVVGGNWDASIVNTITKDNVSNYINGTLASVNTAHSFSLDIPFYLGTINGSGTPATYYFVGRIYSCKLWDANGVLVRDYIPVRVGTTGYLYDRVSGKLFGNAGTGDFVLGQDVKPVEWIQTDGSAYIDTGLEMADGHEVRAEHYFKRATTRQLMGSNASRQYYGVSADGYVEFGLLGTNKSTVSVDEAKKYLISYAASGGNNTGSIYEGNTLLWSSSGAYYGFSNSFKIFRLSTNARLSFVAGNKIASFKHIASGETIQSLLSVRVGTGSTWEGAMMDVLTRRIYRNAGTGAFGYGNDLKYPIPAE